MPRIAAALLGAICWLALGLRIAATNAVTHDLPATLWILARFFTITTNLAVAVAMTCVAMGKRLSDSLLGGLTLAMLLVGIVYAILLAKLYHLTGITLAADILMHKVAPIGISLYWLAFAPHGRLRWNAPLWWSLYPIAYFAYAIVRGAMDGHYPYPFMDVGRIGLGATLVNAAVIASAFIAAGEGLVWLDQRVLGRAPRLAKAGR